MLASIGDVSPAAEAAERSGGVVRFATFNVKELSREKLDRIDAEGRGTDVQLKNAAAVVQAVRPDVLLVNEIDFDDDRRNAGLFLSRYLSVPQGGWEPIGYPHVFFEPVNTGVPTGLDLNRDGGTDGPDDAFGYGKHPGQYGMALYSRFPIDAAAARTFRLLKWKDQPGNVLPGGAGGRPAWYPAAAVEILRLSSKSHWDVPVRVGGSTVHVLASHPTPPVFDGPEDRNGRRNHDEIRLWADYLTGGAAAAYLVDDSGRRGGLPGDAAFVVMGDLNSDPQKGARFKGAAAVRQLLDHPRVRDPSPTSRGAVAAFPKVGAEAAGRRTSDFGRLDYVLPSADLAVVGSGVFWPTKDEPLGEAVAVPERSSDHCLVWVDLRIE